MMPASAPSSPAQAYQAAVQEMIAGSSPALFVTLAFNRDTTPAAAEAKARQFNLRIARLLFGRFATKKTELWPTVFAVMENVETNLHWHLAVSCADDLADRFAEVAGVIWHKLVPSGSVDIQRVSDPDGLGAYMAKQLTCGRQDRLLLLP